MNNVKPSETFVVPCAICEVEQTIIVSEEGLDKYREGAAVQDCFPEMSADHREMLISRTCGKCWKKMFTFEEEA